MILLDTNVISELMKPSPDAAVIERLGGHTRRDLSTTSITKAEILYGIIRLSDGRRKNALAADAERLFRGDFPAPLLAFDDSAAAHYASILDTRRRTGRPMAALDAQIAAIAAAHNAAVATRNIGDFEGCGIALINPWEAA